MKRSAECPWNTASRIDLQTENNGNQIAITLEICGRQEGSRGTKRLVSVNICSVEGTSAGIFVSKVLPGIFVMQEK